jgi:hypothetical protein
LRGFESAVYPYIGRLRSEIVQIPIHGLLHRLMVTSIELRMLKLAWAAWECSVKMLLAKRSHGHTSKMIDARVLTSSRDFLVSTDKSKLCLSLFRQESITAMVLG